jgi:hypothetical protein
VTITAGLSDLAVAADALRTEHAELDAWLRLPDQRAGIDAVSAGTDPPAGSEVPDAMRRRGALRRVLEALEASA